MSKFSKITQVLFFCILALLCCYQITSAQSGRVKNEAPSEQKPPVYVKPVQTEKGTQTSDAPVRVSSLIVVGEVQHTFKVFKSTMIGSALKEFVRMLKSATRTVTKGSGKVNYEEAKKLAEKETETYILWVGFLVKDAGLGRDYIDTIQYAVLTPKTAKVLTRGEIMPGEKMVAAPGGVLQNDRRRLGSGVQLELGVREIVDILLRYDWLE